MEWPEWWEWDLELSPHLFKRMVDRGFNEADVRLMLEEATAYSKNHEEGRFAIETSHQGRPWEVIVEPDDSAKVLVVITAYPVESPGGES